MPLLTRNPPRSGDIPVAVLRLRVQRHTARLRDLRSPPWPRSGRHGQAGAATDSVRSEILRCQRTASALGRHLGEGREGRRETGEGRGLGRMGPIGPMGLICRRMRAWVISILLRRSGYGATGSGRFCLFSGMFAGDFGTEILGFMTFNFGNVLRFCDGTVLGRVRVGGKRRGAEAQRSRRERHGEFRHCFRAFCMGCVRPGVFGKV